MGPIDGGFEHVAKHLDQRGSSEGRDYSGLIYESPIEFHWDVVSLAPWATGSL